MKEKIKDSSKFKGVPTDKCWAVTGFEKHIEFVLFSEIAYEAGFTWWTGFPFEKGPCTSWHEFRKDNAIDVIRGRSYGINSNELKNAVIIQSKKFIFDNQHLLDEYHSRYLTPLNLKITFENEISKLKNYFNSEKEIKKTEIIKKLTKFVNKLYETKNKRANIS